MNKGFSLRGFLFDSIQRRLTFGLVMLVLFLVATSIVAIVLSQRSMEQTIGATSVNLASQVMDDIDRTIFNRLSASKSMVKEVANHYADILEGSNKFFAALDDPEKYMSDKDEEWILQNQTTLMQGVLKNDLAKVLREHMNFYAEEQGRIVFAEIFVTNRFGAIVASTEKTSDYKQNDELWWQHARSEGVYVSDIVYDESAGVYSLEIALRIEDRMGDFVGVMKFILVMKFHELISVSTRRTPAPSYAVQNFNIITREGKVVFSTEDHPIMSDFSETETLRQVQSHEEGYFTAIEAREDEKFIAFVHSQGFRSFHGLGWILWTEYNAQEVLSPIVQLRNTIFVTVAIFLSLCILLSVKISRSITVPLKKLYEATMIAERGDYSTRVNIPTGDELEQLGNAFNGMIATMEKTSRVRKEIDSAKTQFISITSHELRSPMTPMKAQLQMLLQGYFGKLNKKQKDALDIVLRNTDRLDHVIMDFLEISRIEAARLKFNFQKTDLTEHIKRLVDEMKGFDPAKSVKIGFSMKKLPVIEADPDRVMQVLRNLINNAIKFSKQNGKIWINVESVGDYLIFSVKDDGIGIPYEKQGRIFEPFYQAEQTLSRKYGGTGLGLAICKGIIESQSGKIWMKSIPEKGTIFTFTIPKQPVKKMMPITLLFSAQQSRDHRLEEMFKEFLGPLSVHEFETLREQGMNDKAVQEYLKELEQKSIVSKIEFEEMQKRVREIMEGRLTPEKMSQVEEICLNILGPKYGDICHTLQKDLNEQGMKKQLLKLQKSGKITAMEAKVLEEKLMQIIRKPDIEYKIGEYLG